MNTIKHPLLLPSKICNYAANPIEMFRSVLNKMDREPIKMNLATLDKEFGVLNRTVVYRGLTEEDSPHICFVTEKNSRKYQNLKENPKISLTFLYDGPQEIWQVRLFDAEAVELNDDEVKKLWQKEPLFAKIRSHICECGKPNNGEELTRKYQEVYEYYEKESKEPDQTET